MNIQDRYNQLVAKKNLLKQQKKTQRKKIQDLLERIQDYKDTRTILNQAIKITHQRFKDEIETVITHAVKTIFNRDFRFELQYEEKRNGIESKIVVKENGYELDPQDEMGGSIIDIISFAFRIILWHISAERKRNLFILDEPFKWTGKLIELAGMVLKELSQKLNFQVIMITHDNDLLGFADQIFKVKHNGTKSIILKRRIKGYQQ